jgi:hypothetical protein
MGARLSTLLRAFITNGFVAPAHLPLGVAMVLSATMRLPFSALDRLHLGLAGSDQPRRCLSSDTGGAVRLISTT